VNEDAVLLLLGFSGVAATFAGFSAAVTVFGRRHRGEWHPEDRFRLRVMLANSLAACFFSFLPLVIAQSRLPLSAGLVIDSTLLGVFCIIVTIAASLARRKVNRQRPGASPTWFYVLFLVAESTTILSQILNVVGVPFGHVLVAFVGGLFTLLALAGSQFAFLVLKPLAETESSQTPWEPTP
jgi:hypothetical protein